MTPGATACGSLIRRRPPVDRYRTSLAGTLSVRAPGVLANDTDPEGDPLGVQLVTGPSSGQVTLNPNGSFTYRPGLVFLLVGRDRFTYRATDGTDTCNVATVTLTRGLL